MEIQYNGATSVKINTKRSMIAVDLVSDIVNLKKDKKATIALSSQSVFTPEARDGLFIIEGPGEYEFEDCSIKGIPAQPFQGSIGDKSATVYRLSSADITVLAVGNINEKLNEEQLESIGVVDILIIPVGGNGYTLDALGASTIVRSIEPRVVVPVYYSEDSVEYEVAPASLELFTKELGAVAEDTVEKYKIKNLPEPLVIQPISVS